MTEEGKQQAKKEVFLKDYQPPPYRVDKVDIGFDLSPGDTVVTTEQVIEPRQGNHGGALELDGAPEVALRELKVNGEEVKKENFERTALGGLVVKQPPEGRFTLTTVVQIDPSSNLSLEGLYMSGGNFTTQMEAQGFRNVTFFYDRPDVMPKWTTWIRADKKEYPVLLSNGDLVQQRDLEDGRHEAKWQDPFRKPSYLFALVAGQLAETRDKHVTSSGKEVALRIFTEEHNKHKVDFHLESLKKAMAWDERTYGCEYDLDEYKTVIVDDFNMGAMENKSLVIFNSKRALATPDTATDAEFASIEGVVGHEYFHNWTGNRITCRDWFQLSLKEGLTVFRERHFCGDMNSHSIQRIEDTKVLRRIQFPEDAGSSAHPVRPPSYVKMDNFYTPTVYEKGSEVISMLRHLVGSHGFRRGFDLYRERHDGQAVTCEDWVKAHADANGLDLSQFMLWYSQAGTPVLTFRGQYDEKSKTYTLKISQYTPPTPGEPKKEPLLMPVNVGLLSSDGKDIPLRIRGQQPPAGGPPSTVMFKMSDWEHTFVFEDVPEKPVLSPLRGFTAPVKVDSGLSKEELAFLLAHDSDDFNRWDSGQTLFTNMIIDCYQSRLAGSEMRADPLVVDATRKALEESLEEGADRAFFAKVLDIPDVGEVVESLEEADPVVLHEARAFVRKSIASELRELLRRVVDANDEREYSREREGRAKRSMKNAALGLLAELREDAIAQELLRRCNEATNMTDRLGALRCLNDWPCPEREEAHRQLQEAFRNDSFVMNSWLTLQGQSNLENNLETVRNVMESDVFNIQVPNNNYSLLGGFTNSPLNFHKDDGSGYKFLADTLLEIDGFNPQCAARLVKKLVNFHKFDKHRQNLMRKQLQRLADYPDLSPNSQEMVMKGLANE